MKMKDYLIEGREFPTVCGPATLIAIEGTDYLVRFNNTGAETWTKGNPLLDGRVLDYTGLYPDKAVALLGKIKGTLYLVRNHEGEWSAHTDREAISSHYGIGGWTVKKVIDRELYSPIIADVIKLR